MSCHALIVCFKALSIKSFAIPEKISVTWSYRFNNLHADHLTSCEMLPWSDLPVSNCVTLHGSMQSKRRDATCWDSFRSCASRLCWDRLDFCFKLTCWVVCILPRGLKRWGRKEQLGEPVSSQHSPPYSPPFRLRLLIVSLGEVAVVQQEEGGTYIWCE